MKFKIIPFIYFFALMSFVAQAKPLDQFILPVTPPQKMPPLVFIDAGGVQHALSDYRGRFVLLNIWATWCAPCVAEMASLDGLQAAVDPHQLTIIPLAQDGDADKVAIIYRRQGVAHLPVAVDAAAVATRALNVQGYPTSFLIDPQGMEIAHMDGDAKWDSQAMKDYFAGRISATTHP